LVGIIYVQEKTDPDNCEIIIPSGRLAQLEKTRRTKKVQFPTIAKPGRKKGQRVFPPISFEEDENSDAEEPPTIPAGYIQSTSNRDILVQISNVEDEVRNDWPNDTTEIPSQPPMANELCTEVDPDNFVEPGNETVCLTENTPSETNSQASQKRKKRQWFALVNVAEIPPSKYKQAQQAHDAIISNPSTPRPKRQKELVQ
jgi:hypothetical protein